MSRDITCQRCPETAQTRVPSVPWHRQPRRSGSGQTSHGRMVSSGLSDVFGFVGLAVVPGDVFVVEASVVEASVKDADEVVAEGS